MLKSTKKNGIKGKSNNNKPITEGRLNYLFKDMKDFVRSTVKGSETALRKEFRTDFGRLETAITEHSKQIIGLNESVKDLNEKVTENSKQINNVRTDLTDKMDNMEKRLTDKIGGQGLTLNNHEERLTTLENAGNL